MMKKAMLFFLLLVGAFSGEAQVNKMLGKWNTIDDHSGAVRTRVNIYQAKDKMYYGVIEAVYEKNKQGEYVEVNPVQKDLIGMKVLKEMKEKDGELKGSAYDPESKGTYYGKISYDPQKDQIVLRGSLDKWGMIGRSQTWVRYKNQGKK